MSRAALLLALLALGCAGADAEASLDDLSASSGAPVAEWLAPDHAAAAAQARWGMPIPCAGLRVVDLPRAELAAACEADAGDVDGCWQAHSCEIDLAEGLAAPHRDVVLTHELGHLLARSVVERHVENGCPEATPGAHLMCAYGPASGSPDPTPEDFDLVLEP